MGTEIWVALIAAGASLIGNLIVSYSANKAREAKVDVKLAVIETEVKDLKEEVRKHNGVIERTYKIENEIQHLKHYHGE